MKSFNLTEWALNHRAVVLFLILVIAMAGGLGFTRLGQLEDPKFSVPSMTAMVMWPGATAQQVQDELLNRMEKKFEQLDHFEKVVTFARQGYGGMTITVKGGTSKADQQEAWYQARKKLSDIRLDLPEGVIGPVFNDEYGDVYGLLYAVKGDGIGQAELSDVSEDIKRRLLKVPMVKKVDVLGKQAERVYVEFSHERLAALGITPKLIVESLQTPEQHRGRGLHRHARRSRVRARQRSIHEHRRHPQRADRGRRTHDQAGRLHHRRARIRGSADLHHPPQRPAGADARHRHDRRRQHRGPRQGDRNRGQRHPGRACRTAWSSSASPISPRRSRRRCGISSARCSRHLIIVIIVSLLSLGWRTGIVVAMSVPLVLGGVAIAMLAMGWNLERISLGSLIIALGLLVDDSIIAVEMMVVKMEAGWDRVKAAAFSYSSTAMPRLTGALITVAAFMPIGFSKSTTGEYAGGIFWIVGAAVLFSWLVSGLFTPYLAVKMLPKDLGKHHAGAIPMTRGFYRKLRRWIDLAVERRWWVIGATAAALVLAVAGMKLVPQQFFPSSTRPELIVELRVKEGASFAATTEKVKRMEAVLSKDEDVRLFTAYTGAGAPRFYLSLNPELPNPGYAQFIVMTTDLEARERVRSRLMAMADQDLPGHLGAGHAPGARATGGLPGAVSRRRTRHPGGARDRARRRARGGGESRACAMCSSTGTIRCARCASSSTRTRRARSVSRPRTWRS